MKNHHVPWAFPAALILATAVCAAHAIEFEYVKIAQDDDPLPGGDDRFLKIYDFDIEDSQIVFTASSDGGPHARGVFKFADGALTRVASTSTPIPGGTGNFDTFASPSISGGEVAFRGLDTSLKSGIYVTRQGSLSRVADGTVPVAGTTDLFFGSRQPNDLRAGVNSALSAGQLVFGVNSPSPGVYLSKADGSTVALTGTGLPITGLGPGTIDGDKVAFVGAENGVRGIFRYSISANAMTPVVPPGTIFPNGALPAFREVPAISGNTVAFLVETAMDSPQGIYLADDTGVHLVVDGNTPVPGSTGTFRTGPSGLGLYGVTNSEGNIAFYGPRTSGGFGIYTTLGGTLKEVISSDDLLDGRAVGAVPGLTIAPPKIDGGNILFNVEVADGKSALYVAMSEHRWTAAGGGAWGTSANWSFGMGPRHVIPTFVDPANGGVIIGPATTTALKSLTIGAVESGVAEFQMQSGTQINVGGVVSITSRGRLDLNGVLTAADGVDNSGVIASGSVSQIAGQLINRNGGEVRVMAGQRLTIAGGPSSNAGIFGVTGGELEITGALINAAATGAITARDATLRFGQLTNQGALAFVAGTSDVHGDIQNTGSIVVSGGTGAGTQTVIFHDDVVQNGTLSVSASGVTRSVAVFLGGFSGAGGITGGGDVFFEGDLRPGNSPVSVTYSANVSLASGARMTMELGGRAVGTHYDHLAVTGDFHLGGTLSIALLDSFSPVNGDRFDLFDFNPARVSGNFGSMELPALAGDLSWDTSQLTSTGELAVVPEPASAVLLGLGALALIRRSRARGAMLPR